MYSVEKEDHIVRKQTMLMMPKEGNSDKCQYLCVHVAISQIE